MGYGNVLPITALVGGVGAAGGFLYDRYIRGNKKLEDNFKTMLITGGIGSIIGAATSIGSAYIDSQKGIVENTVESLKDPEIFGKGAALPVIGGTAAGTAAFVGYTRGARRAANTNQQQTQRADQLFQDPQAQREILERARAFEAANLEARTNAARAGQPVPDPVNLINRRGGGAQTAATKKGGFWSGKGRALNPFAPPSKPGLLRRTGKSMAVVALTTAALEGARQLLIAD